MLSDQFADHKRLIAGLKHEPAYIALCDFFQAHVDNLEDELAEASENSKILHLIRVWQVTRRLTNLLKTAPEAIDEAIREESNIEPFDKEEDPFTYHRRPTLPPPVFPTYESHEEE